jgi:putative sigma-54 modulation protein
VILETHGKLEHSVKATAHLAGIEIHAHATEEDMYKAIDALVHKLMRQIESHKAKLMEHRDQKHNIVAEE